MKLTALALLTLIAIPFAGPRTAEACTVIPVNAKVQKNDLVVQALNAMDVSIEDVVSIEVSDYSGAYIWTPMCPKGLTSAATFTVQFDSGDEKTGACTATVTVSKNFLYEKGMPEYDVELVQAPMCTAN